MLPQHVSQTNTAKVCDCLQFLLEQVSADNGYRTKKIVVDRTHDTRKINQDQAQEYRENPSMVIIKVGSTKLLRTGHPGMRGTLGNEKRKEQIIELICKQSLTTEQADAGYTMDQIQDELRLDLEFGVIYKDPTLVNTSNAISQLVPGWGMGPSYLNPLITSVTPGPILKYPHCVQVLTLTYLYGERLPIGSSGGNY